MQTTSSVNSNYSLPGTAERKVTGTLDKNAFLQLFIAQLKNQDPLNPQDSSSFMAQMAQFSTLEQLTNMNKEISQMRLSQEMSEASTLLGRTVKVLTREGEVVGPVQKVSYYGQEVKLYINGKGYDLYQVSEVYPGENGLAAELSALKRTQELMAASALLGRQVTIRSGQEEVVGPVEKVYVNGNQFLMYVNGTGYGLEQVTEVK